MILEITLLRLIQVDYLVNSKIFFYNYKFLNVHTKLKHKSLELFLKAMYAVFIYENKIHDQQIVKKITQLVNLQAFLKDNVTELFYNKYLTQRLWFSNRYNNNKLNKKTFDNCRKIEFKK